VHCTYLQVSQDQEAKANEKEAREQARKTKEAAQLYAALQVQQSQLDELWHKYQAPCSAICLPLHPLYHMLMTVFRKRYLQTAMHARAYARNANVCIQPNELGKKITRDLEEQRQQAQQERALRKLWEEKEKSRKQELQVCEGCGCALASRPCCWII
jgi:hypothetical protein